MFTPPARQSMSDSELQEALGAAQANEAGILAAMELLESQSALRQIDDRNFNEWVNELSALGSKEALQAIENAKRVASGLEPIDFDPDISEGIVDQSAAPAELPKSSPPLDDFSESLNRFYADNNQIPAGPAASSDYLDQEPQAIYDAHEVEELKNTDDALEAEELTSIDDAHGAEELQSADEHLSKENDANDEDVKVNFSSPDFEAVTESDFDHIVSPEHADIEASKTKPEIIFAEEAAAQSKLTWSTVLRSVSVFGGPVALITALGVKYLATNFATGALALVIGIALAGFVSIAISLAHHRSGHSTLEASRAAFGVLGNSVPGLFATIARIVILSAVLFGSSIIALTNVSPNGLDLPAAIIAGVCALAITAAGALVSRALAGSAIALVIATLFALLTLATTATALPSQSTFMSFNPGPADWNQVLAIAAVVFALFVSLFSPVAQDIASAKIVFAKKLPTLALSQIVVPLFFAILTLWISFGLDVEMGQANFDLFGTVNLSVPAIIATLSSLVLLVGFIFPSIANSLKATLPRLGSVSGAVFALVLIIVSIIGLSLSWQGKQGMLVIAFVSSIAVIPIIAWAGVFVADALLRRVAYHDVSLVRSYGFYKPFNLVNLSGWLVAFLIGISVIKAPEGVFGPIGGFGYALFPQLAADVASSGLAPALVFVIAFATPIALGIPRIRSQEREVLALEARRDDLKDIFRFGE